MNTRRTFRIPRRTAIPERPLIWPLYKPQRDNGLLMIAVIAVIASGLLIAYTQLFLKYPCQHP